jgi:hypothetical protein
LELGSVLVAVLDLALAAAVPAVVQLSAAAVPSLVFILAALCLHSVMLVGHFRPLVLFFSLLLFLSPESS